MALCVAIVAPSWSAAKPAPGPEIGANEIKLGQEAAAEVAKDSKFITDPAILERVRTIGQKIVKVANSKSIVALYGSDRVTPFEFDFQVIADKDVNAFSTPGGHVYINKGLLDFVQSDQELAGVIAHEITHASHHHMVYLIKKSEGASNLGALAVLATILSGARRQTSAT